MSPEKFIVPSPGARRGGETVWRGDALMKYDFLVPGGAGGNLVFRRGQKTNKRYHKAVEQITTPSRSPVFSRPSTRRSSAPGARATAPGRAADAT